MHNQDNIINTYRRDSASLELRLFMFKKQKQFNANALLGQPKINNTLDFLAAINDIAILNNFLQRLIHACSRVHNHYNIVRRNSASFGYIC